MSIIIWGKVCWLEAPGITQGHELAEGPAGIRKQGFRLLW